MYETKVLLDTEFLYGINLSPYVVKTRYLWSLCVICFFIHVPFTLAGQRKVGITVEVAAEAEKETDTETETGIGTRTGRGGIVLDHIPDPGLAQETGTGTGIGIGTEIETEIVAKEERNLPAGPSAHPALRKKTETGRTNT